MTADLLAQALESVLLWGVDSNYEKAEQAAREAREALAAYRTQSPAEGDELTKIQAAAWVSVCDLLHELCGCWHANGDTVVAAALATIRHLARVQPKHTALGQYGYGDLFAAIAAATRIGPGGIGIEVSVQKFRESLQSAAPSPAPAPEKPLPAELGEWLTAIGELYIVMGRPKFEATEPTLGVVETLREAAKRLAAASPAVGADLVKAVVDAARAAMDESFEAGNEAMDVSIPAHLAAALCLCLDEHDRAAGLLDVPVQPIGGA